MTWAIYSRYGDTPTRVLYSHLSEKDADEEVDRLNWACTEAGLPAIYWTEPHHPDSVFVIG